MANREEFLALVWDDINRPVQEHWIDNLLRYSEHNADAPFADAGDALRRLLGLGASRRDLSLVVRHASYEEAFNLLALLDDPGVDDGITEGLSEELLGADPSGMAGRPGSAPCAEPDSAVG